MIPILPIALEKGLILDVLPLYVSLAKILLEHASVTRSCLLVPTVLLDSIVWRIFLILGLMKAANLNVWITNMLFPISVKTTGNVWILQKNQLPVLVSFTFNVKRMLFQTPRN